MTVMEYCRMTYKKKKSRKNENEDVNDANDR